MITTMKTNIWANEQLSFHAKGVYELLGHYANPYTGECWPGIDTLSRKAGLSRPTIIKAIVELETGDVIAVRRKKGASSRYILPVKLSTTGQCRLQPPVNRVDPKERTSPQNDYDEQNQRRGNVPFFGQHSLPPVNRQSRAMQSLGLVAVETTNGEVLLYDTE
jgi:hypothetical protein